MDTKQCSRCGETKPLGAFSADTRYLGGRKGQWKQANRDRAVLAEGKRRAAVRFTVTRRDLRRLMDRQRGICNVCNETLKVPQVDHIIPLARGGTHGIVNLQYLCALCNQRKNKRVMTEMRKGGGR